MVKSAGVSKAAKGSILNGNDEPANEVNEEAGSAGAGGEHPEEANDVRIESEAARDTSADASKDAPIAGTKKQGRGHQDQSGKAPSPGVASP